MDFGAAIQFIFQDQDWIKKILIMTLITLIPFVGAFVLLGWSLQIARAVKRGDAVVALPELNFGEQLREGFMVFLGYLIYSIPALVLSCFYALPALLAENMDEETLATLLVVVQVCVSCVILIYYIAVYFVFVPGYIRYMDSGEFSAFTGIGENIATARENVGVLGQLLLFIILANLVGSLAISLLSFICLIGLVVTPMLAAVQSHLIGQAARKLVGGAPAV